MMRRAHLASLLKEHCLVEGGDSNVKQWLKDEGLDASVATALKVCFQAEMLCPGYRLNSAAFCHPHKDVILWSGGIHVLQLCVMPKMTSHQT